MSQASALIQYLLGLSQIDWPIKARLRSGLPVNHVRVDLLRSGVSPAPELIDFFSTVNGTIDDDFATLDQIVVIPGYFPLSLTEAVSEFSLEIGCSSGSRLFPILSDGMGSWFCVDVTETSSTYGYVVECQKGFLPAVQYGSIERMFWTMTTALREKVIFVDQGQYLEQNDLAFSQIAARLNPEIEFWHSE